MRIADPKAAPDLPHDALAGIDRADDAAQTWLDGRAASSADRIALGSKAAAKLAAGSAPAPLICAAASDEFRTISIGGRALNCWEGLYSLE
jgi:hypothetical protein